MTVSYPLLKQAEVSQGNGVNYSVAASHVSSNDDSVDDVSTTLTPTPSEKFKVMFPDSFYISVLNNGPPGAFSIRYIYTPKDNDDTARTERWFS